MATTTERGYGRTHQQERARWAPLVHAGEAYCAETVCLADDRWIHPDAAWDLAHAADRAGYLGPAHMRCNRSEGGRRRHGDTGANVDMGWFL